MATEIMLPKLGFTMTEGTITEWLVADGASVQEGQPIYVLEAEKATQEIESPASGTLEILAPTGEELAVGVVVGKIS
jgi:pyruvate/2-oxoglutarate dehydrogenase complex dihydrolipoamide acyltransferase (E2) component